MDLMIFLHQNALLACEDTGNKTKDSQAKEAGALADGYTLARTAALRDEKRYVISFSK